MLNKKSLLTIMLGLSIFIVSCGTAPKANSKETLASPSNLTGSVDLEFVTDRAADIFASMDKSQDGVLDPSEYGNIPGWLSSVKSKPRVTIIDFVEAAQGKFKAYAKTNPKFLTGAEFAAMEASK